MAVKKLFWENPYLTQTKATITNVSDNIITLDKTVAFAFSGGQQSDFGTIENYEIINSNKDDKEIFYTITPNHSLKKDDLVLVQIDWEKRYKIMKLHFAAELVLELMYQEFNYPPKIGANITFEKARVDFYWNGNISSTFSTIEPKIKNIINSNLKIISDFEDIEKEKRYWQIKGFAKVPCGGTHLKTTGEIGQIFLKRVNIGKGKERIEIQIS